MMCAWKEFLAILPAWLRQEVDGQGREDLQELRLRLGSPPELVMPGGTEVSQRKITRDDLSFCINTASRYSPWSAATMAEGYITAPGGHRIGICGEAICKDGQVTGIREVTSLCIRVARDFPGIGKLALDLRGSILILGAPGWGKTTLLRDMARQLAALGPVAVVDERRELFPEGFDRTGSLDILTGCPKAQGLDMVLRTMGPRYIALDEITAEEDCRGLIQAANCGVTLLATAHAGSSRDFRARRIYWPLVEQRIFQNLVVLHRDKTCTVERMDA